MTQPADFGHDALTLELVARQLRTTVEGGETVYDAAARILDALAAAAALLPPGTETRAEWATRLKAHDEYDEELSESWANSVMTEEERARNRAHHWRRRFAPELVDVMRRDVHVTPWTVTEEPA